MNRKEVMERLKYCSAKLWQLADAVGVSEPTITRWLRRPLEGERLLRVITALEQLEKEV